MSLDITLGQLSRLLDHDHFVVVVHRQNLCKYSVLGEYLLVVEKVERRSVHRRVATCKPGKPGLTSFSEP